MAIPIIQNWKNYFKDPDEGLGSSYERVILNGKLVQICKYFEAKNILEVPSFGFTGVSGINSMELAKRGYDVTIVDHDKNRLKQINDLWADLEYKLISKFIIDYFFLPFDNNAFDLSWNFSALWFTKDLEKFLAELSRVTKKVIFLCVPNRSGLGYLSQKYFGKDYLNKNVFEENIKPKNIKKTMKKLDWQLISSNFIDCPPWPDIGMPKEKFLNKFGLNSRQKEKKRKSISILKYYQGEDENFPAKMMKYSWLETYAPSFIKYFWAHHKYFLFIPKGK